MIERARPKQEAYLRPIAAGVHFGLALVFGAVGVGDLLKVQSYDTVSRVSWTVASLFLIVVSLFLLRTLSGRCGIGDDSEQLRTTHVLPLSGALNVRSGTRGQAHHRALARPLA